VLEENKINTVFVATLLHTSVYYCVYFDRQLSDIVAFYNASVLHVLRFDKMYQGTRKDLEALKNAYQHGDPVPRFHYETRQFSLVQCVLPTILHI